MMLDISQEDKQAVHERCRRDGPIRAQTIRRRGCHCSGGAYSVRSNQVIRCRPPDHQPQFWAPAFVYSHVNKPPALTSPPPPMPALITAPVTTTISLPQTPVNYPPPHYLSHGQSSRHASLRHHSTSSFMPILHPLP